MVYVNFEVVLAMEVPTPGWLRSLATCCEGNASALFVTLAGVGVVLLGDRGLLLRRALFLLVLGYLWQTIWPGDILHYYAFYLAIGAAALGLRARWLWILAVASALGWLGLAQVLDYGAGWRWIDLSYPDFWTVKGQLRNLIFNGWHPLLPWLAFIFTGMAFAKSELHRPERRGGVLLACGVLYGLALLASAFLSSIPDTRPGLDPLERWYAAPEAIWGTASLPPGPLYILSAASTSVAVITFSLALTEREAIARWTRPLRHAGQLALTLYLGHVLVLYFLVHPQLEAHAEAPLELAAVSSALFGGAAIIGSHLWRRRFRRGPLEGAMRALTRRRA